MPVGLYLYLKNQYLECLLVNTGVFECVPVFHSMNRFAYISENIIITITVIEEEKNLTPGSN